MSCSVPHIQAQLDNIFTAGWKTETDFHFSVLSQWVLKPVVERMATTIHLHSCSFIWPSSRPDCWPHARIKLFHYYCANALPSLMRNMQTGCFLKIHFFVRYRTKPTRAQLVRWRASAWMDSHYSVALLSFEWRRSRSWTGMSFFSFWLDFVFNFKFSSWQDYSFNMNWLCRGMSCTFLKKLVSSMARPIARIFKT